LLIDTAIDVLIMLFDPSRLLYMFIGIIIGLSVGLLPGLGGTVGMALVLPFIYGLDPYVGIALMIGMIAVIHTGDTFPSILLGIPGSAGSQATIMDGFPLAKKGEAARALSAAFMSSMIGGIIGAIVLFITIPIVRPIVLSFGSPDLFMLSLLGLSMVGILSSKGSILKGLIAGLVGLAIGVVGSAPAVPVYRYSFDFLYLKSGIPLVVLALGLFAFPVIMDLLISNKKISNQSSNMGRGWIQGIVDVFKHKWLVLRSSLIGTLVGIIPGLGGSVVDWISYGIAKQTSRNNENFGKGDIRGVIAPESSNNAKEGGALIPTMIFGIPGSGTTAVMLGGLMLMGIQTGPRMVTTQVDITLLIIWTLIFANIFGATICMLLSKPISKITTIKPSTLVPFLIIILVLGAYQSTRHWGDIVLFLVVGIFGWIMAKLDWPRAPLLIGFVLSISAERYLFISISRYGMEWLMRPGVMIIALIIIGILSSSFWLNRTKKI
jgi:putative tricarboxylic transport membrane protein